MWIINILLIILGVFAIAVVLNLFIGDGQLIFTTINKIKEIIRAIKNK